MATSVTRFGIEWTFSADKTVGTFANGDYYVVGPVNITAITPATSGTGTDARNGSMVDPVAGATEQGYDGRQSYNATLNKAIGISVGSPLVVANGSCVVSTISHTPEGSDVTVINTAAVLTVLSEAPDANSFRPGYCESTKTVQYNVSDLDYSMLRSFAPSTGAPSLATAAAMFERTWLDHIPNWTSRYFHPDTAMEEYGVSLSMQVAEGALMLNTDYTNAQKETLMIRFVQLGIDNYSVIANGGVSNWEPDGGHAGGRKLPIVFAGMALGVNAMRDIGAGDGTGGLYFGEDAQTFYVTQEDIDRTGKQAWTTPYDSGDLGLEEYGIRHATYPTWDTSTWEDEYNYRELNGFGHYGIALAARMVGADVYWDHDAFFDYCDRWQSIETPTGSFLANMWTDYRDDLDLPATPYLIMY